MARNIPGMDTDLASLPTDDREKLALKNRIWELNEEVRKLKQENHNLELLREGHDYYMLLQKTCMNNESAMELLTQLLVYTRLSTKEPVRGLHCSDDRQMKLL